MNKLSTVGMSKDDWLKHRQAGIGCSDISCILGLNPYKCSTELFYEKVEGSDSKFENAAMFYGTYFEEKIAELYQYWENDQETCMKNYNSGKKINKINKVNAILTNPKYPYLLGNLDRLQTAPFKAVVEIKTISGYALDMWKHGIPPMYLSQLQGYMMLTGLNKSALVILKDGRYLEVYDIPENPDLQKHISELCSEFWERVLAARKLKAEGRPFESLEPEPDTSEAYQNFLKDRYKEKPVTIEGGLELYKAAQSYIDCSTRVKTIESEQQGHKNILLNALKNASVIDFGPRGKVSWKENTKGSRVFNCKLNKV